MLVERSNLKAFNFFKSLLRFQFQKAPNQSKRIKKIRNTRIRSTRRIKIKSIKIRKSTSTTNCKKKKTMRRQKKKLRRKNLQFRSMMD